MGLEPAHSPSSDIRRTILALSATLLLSTVASCATSSIADCGLLQKDYLAASVALDLAHKRDMRNQTSSSCSRQARCEAYTSHSGAWFSATGNKREAKRKVRLIRNQMIKHNCVIVESPPEGTT